MVEGDRVWPSVIEGETDRRVLLIKKTPQVVGWRAPAGWRIPEEKRPREQKRVEVPHGLMKQVSVLQGVVDRWVWLRKQSCSQQDTFTAAAVMAPILSGQNLFDCMQLQHPSVCYH